MTGFEFQDENEIRRAGEQGQLMASRTAQEMMEGGKAAWEGLKASPEAALYGAVPGLGALFPQAQREAGGKVLSGGLGAMQAAFAPFNAPKNVLMEEIAKASQPTGKPSALHPSVLLPALLSGITDFAAFGGPGMAKKGAGLVQKGLTKLKGTGPARQAIQVEAPYSGSLPKKFRPGGWDFEETVKQALASLPEAQRIILEKDPRMVKITEANPFSRAQALFSQRRQAGEIEAPFGARPTDIGEELGHIADEMTGGGQLGRKLPRLESGKNFIDSVLKPQGYPPDTWASELLNLPHLLAGTRNIGSRAMKNVVDAVEKIFMDPAYRTGVLEGIERHHEPARKLSGQMTQKAKRMRQAMKETVREE